MRVKKFFSPFFKKGIIILVVLLIGITGCQNQSKSLTLYQLSNQSYSQMMSYILQTNNNEIIVIDGGTREDSEYLISQIKKINPEGKVKAWFLTHYHKDHTGALSAYLDSQSNELEIENIYYQFPQAEWVENNEPSRYPDYVAITNSLQQNNVQTIQKGDEFIYNDIQIKSLRNFDENIIDNAGNNSSMVYLVATVESRILFLGDLGVEGGNELIEESKEEIKDMDYVQIAHHGQAGVSEEVYQVLNPKYCLWPTTDWVWDNDAGTGKGSGNLKTEETKEWLAKLNVKKHYIAKDGLIKIKIK